MNLDRGPDDSQAYSGPNACKIVGITFRQLDHWDRTDLISPSLAPATGSGSKRRYSFSDLVRLRLVKQLLDSGLSLQKIRRAVEYLESLGDDLVSSQLMLCGDELLAVRDDGEVLDVLRRGQIALFLPPMEDMAREVRRLVSESGLGEAEPGQSATG